MIEIQPCRWCGVEIPTSELCAACEVEFKSRPDPTLMTPEQRVEEIRWFFDGPGQFVQIPWRLMQDRMIRLAGQDPMDFSVFALVNQTLMEAMAGADWGETSIDDRARAAISLVEAAII